MNFLSRLRGIHYFIIAGVIATLGTFGVIGQANAASRDTARDGRLVTFHDRGDERVILTHAQTVRDALQEAKISVVDEDQVEPGLDTQLVATDYAVNIYRARPVIVIDGATREKVMTAAQTPSGIASAANVTLHDEDKTTIAASDDIVSDGASVTLTVKRATEFTLNLYGSPQTAYTQAKTVGEMLKSKNITLASNDTVSASQSTPLTSGMTVSIWRNGVQTATVDEAIAFPVRQVQDVDQPVGYHQIQTPGTNGKKSVTYQITMQNGQEVGRTVIQSVVIDEAKEQVEVIGTKVALPAGSHEDWMATAGMSSANYGYINYIFTRESGWNPAAVNKSGGYYGLGQTNLSKLTDNCGSSWASDPVCQIRVFHSYAVGRYGSWQSAYEFWTKNHWW